MKRNVYRSRISVLFIGIILVVFISCTIPAIKHMVISGLYIIGGTFLLVVFLFCGMRYVILEDKLYLKIWFIPTCSLKITDIVSVKRSYYIFDTPTNTTASFKKLRLQFAREAKCSYVHVSPVREQEFINELTSINSHIYVDVPVKKGIWRFWNWDI